MTIHKEGTPSIVIAILVSTAIIASVHLFFAAIPAIVYSGYLLALFLLIIILQFFRSPTRELNPEDLAVITPADGKVVAIEEVHESEFLQDQRLQVSVFMSPLNVHINWFPIRGLVKYLRYHPGKYLVAWHPKSSTDNERTTIVVEHPNGSSVLLRQIAGALARRIVYYPKEGESIEQGQQMGFIKFGSRVDILLPMDAKVLVNIGDKVTGRQTVLARLAEDHSQS